MSIVNLFEDSSSSNLCDKDVHTDVHMVSDIDGESTTILVAFQLSFTRLIHSLDKFNAIFINKSQACPLNPPSKGSSKANTTSLTGQPFAQGNECRSNDNDNNNNKWRPFWYFEHI